MSLGSPDEKYAWLGVVALACLCLTTRAPANAQCTFEPRTMLYGTRLHVAGRERIKVTIRVPQSTDIAITATENGIDARLEFVGAAPEIPQQAAETPLRRWGPQRLIVSTGLHRTVTLKIIGKEHARAHGMVRLSVFRLSSMSGVQACRDGFRLMGAGDARYALAEMSTIETGPSAGGSAQLEYLAAAHEYQTAATSLKAAGSSLMLAQAYMAEAAVFYQGVQDWNESEQAASHAESLFLRLNDEYGVARARAMRAAAEMEIALSIRSSDGREQERRQEALALVIRTFGEIARVHARRNEPFDEALALNNIGLAYYYAGDFQKSIQGYRKAMPLYAGLSERPREAQVGQNVALVEYEIGRLTQAKRDFAQVLRLIHPRDNLKLYGEILNNRALAEYASGELDSALRHYNAALNLLERIQAVREQARSLQGIGAIYYTAGDRERAIDYFRQGLALRSVALDPRGRMSSLRSLANALSDAHRPADALLLRQEAFALAVAPSMRVRIEAQMSADVAALGDRPKAMSLVERALSQEVAGDQLSRAAALLQRARLRFDAREFTAAKQDAAEAVRISESSESPADAFAALLLAGHIAQAQGAADLADTFADKALNLAEWLRIQSANPELRAGLWQSERPAFDFKIELLTGRDRDATAGGREVNPIIASAALMVAEQSRSRSLADYRLLHVNVTANTDIATARLRSLYREVADRRFELEGRLDRSADEDARVRLLRADISALRREIDALSASPDIADNRSDRGPAALAEVVRHRIEMIPPDTAVIEYWCGEKTAWAWVITSGHVQMINLGSSDVIQDAARQLHNALRNLSSESMEKREQLAMDLHALIIKPLPEEALRYKFLVVIPDGALHYVSFAVLADRVQGNLQYLIDRNVVSTAPSFASMGAVEFGRANLHVARALVVSDPVYSSTDDRVRRDIHQGRPGSTGSESMPLRGIATNHNFERLPGTFREAQSLAQLLQHSEIDGLSGFNATRAQFLNRDLSQYQIIHIAAHAVSDSGSPSLSALILSEVDRDGNAMPGEVFAGELLIRTIAADLVVLSACDTAFGREVPGEGLLGLRYAAHAAGANSVVASLWEVPDRAAADLMNAFYVRILRGRESPPVALAGAMREMRSRFPDPSIWGPFEISVTGRGAAPLNK